MLMTGVVGLAAAALAFEPNRGQSSPSAEFVAHTGDGVVWVSPQGVALSDGLALRWLDARATKGEALDPLPGTSSYFTSSGAHTGVPTFARLAYRSIYPGVDVIFHGDARHLEHDFVLAPGVDGRAIRWAVDGAEARWLDARGDLHLRRGRDELVEAKPVAYQERDGRHVTVASRFTLDAKGHLGIALGAHDAKRGVVIDPIVAFTRTFGGSVDQQAESVAMDPAGNVYICGYTASADFPAVGTFAGGYSDVYVTKLSPAGVVQYSVFIGGNNEESAQAIAVDAQGNAYVGGDSQSPDFPTTDGGFMPKGFQFDGGAWNQYHRDAFVLKLNPSGTQLLYSTFVGGTSEDTVRGLALDALGNAYIAGYTSSPDYPTTAGAYQPVFADAGPFNPSATRVTDAFITKLNPTGSALVYSTFFGGSTYDFAYALAVDSSGRAYITGITDSQDLPLTANAVDSNRDGGFYRWPDGGLYVLEDGGLIAGFNDVAFAARLSADGTQLEYSTYVGGTGGEEGWGIAVDAVGAMYVAGYTASFDFPTTPGAVTDAVHGQLAGFVVKIPPSGNAYDYAAMLGGSNLDYIKALAVDDGGCAYVVGATLSNDFPLTAGAFAVPPIPDAGPNSAIGPGYGPEGFISVLDPTGTSLRWSSRCGAPVTIPEAIAIQSPGVFAVAGANNLAGAVASDAFVIKVDLNTDDAGVIDAGGVADAGADAGTPDAGIADAGIADAGLYDAGLYDGGGGDAGVVDAGTLDAGASAVIPRLQAEGPAAQTCGCSAQPGVLLLGALVLKRRRRRLIQL